MADLDAVLASIAQGIAKAEEDFKAKPHKEKKDQLSKRIQPAALHGIEPRIVEFERLASQRGLSSTQLNDLISLATNPILSDRVQARLLHCLLPSTYVTEQTIVNLLGTFTSQSHSTQAVILKWIILVFDLLTSTHAIHRLYALFFRHISFDILRPFLVSILYRITRKDDVQPFRVRQLQTLVAQNPSDQHLVALLLLFKEFNRDIVVTAKLTTRAQLFKSPDKLWQQQIEALQAKREDRTPDMRAATSPLDAAVKFQTISASARKRKTDDPTPQLRTIKGAVAANGVKRKALEDMTTVVELAEHAGQTSMPAQLAALLHEPLIRHAIALDPERSYKLRVGHWLAFMLDEELSSPPNPARTLVLLRNLVQVSEFFGELAPSIIGFLVQYLPTWLGTENCESILALLSFTPPMPFEELHTGLLLPLQRTFFVASPLFKSRLIHCLVSLLRRWASVPWAAYYANPRTADPFIWAQLDRNSDYYLAIRDLALFAERLCLLALQADSDHALLQHAVTTLYELVASFVTHYELPFILFPAQGVVYRLLASSDVFAVSRMCGILLQYKSEVAQLKKRSAESELPKLVFDDGSGKASLDLLNSYIWNFCTALWRNMLFSVGKDGQYVETLGLSQNLVQLLQHPDIGSSLSITCGCAFSGLTSQFLIEMKRSLEEEFAHPREVKGEHKNRYLEFLRDRNLHGLFEFLSTFINALATRYVRSPQIASTFAQS